jgi:hypothetical protein
MVEQVKGFWLRNFLKSKLCLLGILIITLAACGGGGYGGDAETPAPSGYCDAACVAKAAADEAAATAAATAAAAAAAAAATAAAEAAAAAKFTIGLGIPKEMDVVRVQEDI